MFGTQSVDWPAVGVLSFSIITGGFTMAWRLGALVNRVKDLERRIGELEGHHSWNGVERRRMSPAQRARRQRDP
jgi:hypothetical protein